MTLAAGTWLGPYEILAPLGAGGMGEVYRARDTRLDRQVAVKVLPERLSADADALARFEREAKAVAALSHPNILALHDFGTHEGAAYAVMELLEGETLRARLERGPLVPRKAVDCAVQIARGLAAAHEKGIVHRDLKPENVFLTSDGHVKVLDFGLAKRAPERVEGMGETLTKAAVPGTEPGTVMGTVGYMSPEQVRGEAVDHRSDIFSFGAVLYEMLAGRRAFSGSTAVETMNAILKEEPPELAASGPGSSPALQRIVQHCLEKKPGERFQSARDIAFYLRDAPGSGPSAAIPRKGGRLSLAAVAIAILLGLVGLELYRVTHAPALPVFRQVTFQPSEIYEARFGPEGREVVFDASQGENEASLSSVRLDTVEERPLGIAPARLLALSEQGELAVLAHPQRDTGAYSLWRGTLALAPSTGIAPREVLPDVVAGDISSRGEKAVLRFVDGRFRIECPIGRVRIDRGAQIRTLRFSPDGRYLAFLENPDGNARIGLVDLQGGEPRILSDADYASGLAWRNDEILFGSRASLGSSEIRAVSLQGRTHPILRLPGIWSVKDVAKDGRLLLAQSPIYSHIRVWNPDARDLDLSVHSNSYLMGLSPDGNQVLLDDYWRWSDEGNPIYIRAVDGAPPVFLGWGSSPTRSPDGTLVAAIPPGPATGIVLLPTGPGESHRLAFASLAILDSVQWTVDGRWLLASGSERGRPPRIWRLGLHGEAPHPLTPEGVASAIERIRPSPDGRFFLAESGNAPVLCDLQDPSVPPRPLPGFEKGEIAAGWAQDSRRVYAVRQGPMPRPVFLLDVFSGRREPWRSFDSPVDKGRWLANPDITLDGRVMAATVFHRPSTLYVLEGLK